MTENNETVSFNFRGNEYKLPLIEGSEGELAIDIRKLRKDTGLITLDPGYLSTEAQCHLLLLLMVKKVSLDIEVTL